MSYKLGGIYEGLDEVMNDERSQGENFGGGKSVVVWGGAENLGVTTLASTLSVLFERRFEGKILCVDLNFVNPDVSKYLGVLDVELDINTVLNMANNEDMQRVLSNRIYRFKGKDLYVVPGSEFAKENYEGFDRDDRVERYVEMVKVLKKEFDLIIWDVGLSTDRMLLSVLRKSSEGFIDVVGQNLHKAIEYFGERVSMWKKIEELTQECCDKKSERLEVIVINKYESKVPFDEVAIRRLVDEKIDVEKVYYSTEIIESVNSVELFKFSEKSLYLKSVSEIADSYAKYFGLRKKRLKGGVFRVFG